MKLITNTLVALALGAGLGCSEKINESSDSKAVGTKAYVTLPDGCNHLMYAHVEMASDFYDELTCCDREPIEGQCPSGTRNFIKEIGEDSWTERVYKR